MSSQFESAKRPLVRQFAGPYGHPYHPILVTVPIGAWLSSLVFDVAAQVVDDSAFLAHGSQWLIAIGLVGALLAAPVGLLDLLVIPRGTAVFRTGLLHMGLNLAVVISYAANLGWRAATEPSADGVPAGPLALSVVTIAALGFSGYLGGKMSFRYGVRVADESTQAEGYRTGVTH